MNDRCLSVKSCFSSVEWSKSVPSASEADLPRIFVKISPTKETFENLLSRKRDVMSINKCAYMNDYNFRKRSKKVVPSPIRPPIDGAVEGSKDQNTNESINVSNGATLENQTPLDPIAVVEAHVSGAETAAPAVLNSDNLFELTVIARRSWKSFSVFLWPGEYYITSSVEYAASVQVSIGIEDKLCDIYVKPKVKSLWAIENEREHRMWAHVSCHKNVKLYPLGSETGSSPAEIGLVIKDFVETVDRMVVDVNNPHSSKEMWPFFIEHQLDTGTTGITEILYRLRRESNLAMTELFSLRVKHQDEFKKLQMPDAEVTAARNSRNV